MSFLPSHYRPLLVKVEQALSFNSLSLSSPAVGALHQAGAERCEHRRTRSEREGLSEPHDRRAGHQQQTVPPSFAAATGMQANSKNQTIMINKYTKVLEVSFCFMAPDSCRPLAVIKNF